ncbi:hypothetical protein GCM10027421_00030 [Microbacterium shaanxiense]
MPVPEYTVAATWRLAVEHASARFEYDACAERLTGRRILRIYAGGYRILCRETRAQITLLYVRRTVRRRWERLL